MAISPGVSSSVFSAQAFAPNAALTYHEVRLPAAKFPAFFAFAMPSPRLALVLLLAVALAAGSSAGGAEPSAEDTQFFEAKIRPILVENCHRCHGEKKQQGKLRLDSLATLLAGGESGPAITPGNPEESLLIEAINYASLEMPPDGRLKPEQVALLTEWVKRGAPWPGSGDVALQPRKTALVVTDEDRQHWSFQPVKQPPQPSIRNPQSAIRNPTDLFILARLAEKQLAPSPEATNRELIRRASFDLAGLPPTVDEIDAFTADERPDAYERTIDRLLASPQHGERWGRHWLDIVRFAQTNGLERDDEKPFAWRYRDYVIGALNADKPYDQFVIEQLAGDEVSPLTDDSLSATGFYRLGVWDDEPDDGKQAKADEFDDIVATTGSAFLGITLGCARCHDHKFDPISQEDYYSITAFFSNIHLYGKVSDIVGGGQPVDKEGVFRQLPSGRGETLCVRERATPPQAINILVRGNAHTPGKPVQPRFVEVLCPTKDATNPELPKYRLAIFDFANSSRGRRTALARWIASEENPLTARVIVNRLWHYHFGRGIVASPSDFGHTGMAPTHPELLDYLASELTGGDWQLKRIHRMIVTSATYRQTSRIADFGFRIADSGAGNPQLIDPANTLLWRQNMRRLEAESLRDNILAASGELNLQMGGRGIFPTLPPEVLEKQSRPGSGWDNKAPAAQQARRSVYIFVKRTLGVPLLESFDVASPDTPTAGRNVTTVAPQALILLNSDFMNQQAAALARRVSKASGADPQQQIAAAYRFALGREPTDRELGLALAFLERETARWSKPDMRAVTEPTESADVQLLGWKHFGGKWQKRDDGGCQVEAHSGAKIVRDGLELSDGTVEAQVMLMDGSGDAGLIVRVREPSLGTDALTAYYINLRKDALRLGKHENNYRDLKSVRLAVEEDKWHDLKVELAGGRIRVFLGGAKEPQIDYTEPDPLKAGSIGFRTYQIDSAVRQIRVTRDGKSEDVPMEYVQPASTASSTAEGRALAELCKLILNLNEFVYVD
jgi:hypothetical protein